MLTLAPLLGSRMLHKNIQDPLRSIQTPSRGQFFQVAALGGRQFIVEHDRIHIVFAAELGELRRLAGADESAGHRRLDFLGAVAHHHAPGGGGQFGQFIQGIARLPA